MTQPLNEADLLELGRAVNERLAAQDAAIEAVCKAFLKFRKEVRENFEIMDSSFESVGQDFQAVEQAIRALGGGDYLVVIEPDAPEKEPDAEAKPRKLH